VSEQQVVKPVEKINIAHFTIFVQFRAPYSALQQSLGHFQVKLSASCLLRMEPMMASLKISFSVDANRQVSSGRGRVDY